MNLTLSKHNEAYQKCREAIQTLMTQSYYDAYSSDPWKMRRERQKRIQKLSDELLGPGESYETLT